MPNPGLALTFFVLLVLLVFDFFERKLSTCVKCEMADTHLGGSDFDMETCSSGLTR